MQEKITTPCTKQCWLDANRVCTGCGRTAEQIGRWKYLPEAQRQRITRVLAQGIFQTMTVKKTGDKVSGDTGSTLFAKALHQVESALPAEADPNSALIAILDANSVIVAVNDVWRAFAQANGASSGGKVGIGASYLAVCENALGETCSEEAAAFATGLKAVLRGKQGRFELVSPCHSPTEQRWFSGQVTRCHADPPLFSVVHCNVTARYQALAQLQRISRRKAA